MVLLMVLVGVIFIINVILIIIKICNILDRLEDDMIDVEMLLMKYRQYIERLNER